MSLFSFIAAIIIYLPIVGNNAPTTPTTVFGSTFTMTEGATCIVKQGDSTQTVISDFDAWCDYQLLPSTEFTVEITEVSDNELLPGAVWGFTCTSTDVSEEYPQHIYGPGCQRSE